LFWDLINQNQVYHNLDRGTDYKDLAILNLKFGSGILLKK